MSARRSVARFLARDLMEMTLSSVLHPLLSKRLTETVSLAVVAESDHSSNPLPELRGEPHRFSYLLEYSPSFAPKLGNTRAGCAFPSAPTGLAHDGGADQQAHPVCERRCC